MRTKDKARRRVTSIRSLESADRPMYPEQAQDGNIVVLGKRQITHVDETVECSPSVGKKPCHSICGKNTNPDETGSHNLYTEVLHETNNTRGLKGSRKRKAVDIYGLPELAPTDGQDMSPDVVVRLPTSPTNKKCKQTYPWLL